jgi:hypothetical protein
MPVEISSRKLKKSGQVSNGKRVQCNMHSHKTVDKPAAKSKETQVITLKIQEMLAEVALTRPC